MYSLMVEMKSSDLDPDSNFNSDTRKGKHVIHAKPSDTITTTEIHPKDLQEME
jgi:hypothetical protein